jgi:hypothetical protein
MSGDLKEEETVLKRKKRCISLEVERSPVSCSFMQTWDFQK